MADESPPSALRSGLALVTGEVLDHRPQVGEVEQRQPGAVGVVEHQPQAGLLGLVEAEHLAQQHRPERLIVTRSGMPMPSPPRAYSSTGKPRACPLLADRGGPLADLLARLPGHGQAGQVALDVGREDRDALGAELLGEQLEGLRLAGAGRAGDEAVPVEHGQRDPHRDVRELVGVEHQAAELERRALEAIAVRDRGGDRVLSRGLGHVAEPSDVRGGSPGLRTWEVEPGKRWLDSRQ